MDGVGTETTSEISPVILGCVKETAFRKCQTLNCKVTNVRLHSLFSSKKSVKMKVVLVVFALLATVLCVTNAIPHCLGWCQGYEDVSCLKRCSRDPDRFMLARNIVTAARPFSDITVKPAIYRQPTPNKKKPQKKPVKTQNVTYTKPYHANTGPKFISALADKDIERNRAAVKPFYSKNKLKFGPASDHYRKPYNHASRRPNKYMGDSPRTLRPFMKESLAPTKFAYVNGRRPVFTASPSTDYAAYRVSSDSNYRYRW